MKPLIDSGLAHTLTQVAHKDLLEHTQSPAFKAFRAWLDSKIAYTQAAMIQANPAHLAEMQTQAKTLISLRAEMDPFQG